MTPRPSKFIEVEKQVLSTYTATTNSPRMLRERRGNMSGQQLNCKDKDTNIQVGRDGEKAAPLAVVEWLWRGAARARKRIQQQPQGY